MYHYWVSKENSEGLINERIQRQELYSLSKYFN